MWRIQLDWVEEIPVDKAFTSWTYLEAVFILDLNVNRALAHHPFLTQSKLSDEQIALAFFPNPKVRQSATDNFCAPELPQEGIIQALENTIHVQMSVLYADLVRALGEVPDFPLSKTPASTWKEAFSWSKLSSLEVNRHLKVDDAPHVARDMSLPFNVAIRRYRERCHIREEEGSSREPAFDRSSISFESILRQGRKGSKVANAAFKVYIKGSNYIRMELRLNKSEGICYDMPKGLFRSNVAFCPNDLVDVILRALFYSQKTFDKFIKKMPNIKTPSMEELVAFFQVLRAEASKEEDKIVVERIISRLEFHVCLDMTLLDDTEMVNMLRRLSRRGFFIRRGASSSPRYYPDIDRGMVK